MALSPKKIKHKSVIIDKDIGEATVTVTIHSRHRDDMRTIVLLDDIKHLVLNENIEITGILKNDDALGTSDTIGATQGNIKAYVDSSFNIASTTKVTASEISSNSENSYVDIPDMEVAITAKRGSSSYLVSGVLSWNSNASNTESIFKVQYKKSN